MNLEILERHYEESNLRVIEANRHRDRLFIYIIAIVGIMLFRMYSSIQANSVFEAIIQKMLDVPSDDSIPKVDLSFVGTLIWFLLTGIVLKYYQLVIYVENQYEYISSLESLLSPNFKNEAFTREGASYSKRYNLFQGWSGILYTIVFPVLLVAFSAIYIYCELQEWSVRGLLMWIDIGSFVVLLVSTVLYFIDRHFK